MSNARTFQKLAGISAILLTAFVLGNVITLIAAVGKDVAAFSDASLLLSMGAASARMFHVSMVLDVLGYLSFAPIAVFCWLWLRHKGEGFVGLFTLGGLAYSLLGALGGVVVDAVLPPLMRAYPTSSGAQMESTKVAARIAYQAVAHGVWNPLEVLLVSVWFLGIGLLIRQERRGLGILALVVSAFGLLDPIGWILGSEAILNIGGVGTVLILVWSLWFGSDLLRNPALLADAAPRSG
jgi:hypothetical protein